MVTGHTATPTTANWRAIYDNQLIGHLQRVIDFVRDNQAQPDAIRPHFYSLVTLLERARERPFLHSLAADLFIALRPWPQFWGYWDDWLRLSHYAIDLLAAHHADAAWGWFQAEAWGWFQADRVAMLFELGQYDAALGVLTDIFAASTPTAVAPALFRAGHTAATKLILIGRGPEGKALYERQADWLADLRPHLSPDAYLYADTLVTLQKTLVMRREGQARDAILLVEQMVARLAGWPDAPLDIRRDVYHHLGGVLAYNGDYPASVAAMRQAIASAVAMQDEYYEAALYGDLAISLWQLSRFDEIETAVRRSALLAEKLRANWRLVRSVNILLEVFVMRRDLDEALVWLPRQIDLTRQLNDNTSLLNAYMIRGTICLLRDRPGDALPDLLAAQAGYGQISAWRFMAWAEAALSWCYVALDEWETAVTAAQRSRQYSQQANVIVMDVLTWRGLARLQSGAEKRTTLQHALRLARDHQMRWFRAACLFDLVPVAETPAERDAFWEEAVAIVQEVGLDVWLDGRSPDHPPVIPLF